MKDMIDTLFFSFLSNYTTGMSFSLANKHILITGATDGLGLAIAKELIKHKAHLIVHGKSRERIEQTVKELKQLGAKKVDSLLCDLTKLETIVPTFSDIDTLDVLINNAGVWLEGNTIDATPEKIIELTKVNTLAPLVISRTLLPRLQESEFGQVLNIVSIAGVEIPTGFYHTIYTATKYAMQGFTEGLAKEFAFKNLRVMGIYPGGMNTNLFKKAGNIYKESESWMFDTKESAEAVVFMLTRDKSVNVKRIDIIKQ